ncbi:dimethylamine monooxygenase subunit DmmA family protein [Arthrobacter sp. PL16]|uniref:dimethylamine monooxygenase subunit DmmA family protein n=1 Tax=Arthrobacter sp. PL16 TaxID=3071720 RepID=UPI002E11EA7C
MLPVSVLPAAAAGLESGFRGVICVAFGSSDGTAGHETGGRPRLDLRFRSANPQALSDLKVVLGASRVGARLVLAGPPADIHAAASLAAGCGLTDEEMTLLPDETGPRVIFCGHCHTRTTTDQPIGSEVDCQGCATTLYFTDHFSRRVGGYLGFSAHAEETT